MAARSPADALRARESGAQQSTAFIADADSANPCPARASLPAQSISDAVPEAVASLKGRLRSASRQSVATSSGGRSCGRAAMAAETSSMDPNVVNDDVAKAALLDMGIGDDAPDFRPARAAALKGRAKTRLMATTTNSASCSPSEGASSSSRNKGKETKTPVLKGPKRIPKNTKPLSQFAWDIPLDEELGSPAFKKQYSKQIKTVRIERNMADKFDPHTPHQVNMNKLEYAMRLRRATEQWPTSNARNAPDDMDTLMENEMLEMRSPPMTSDLEEDIKEEAEKAKREQLNDCDEDVDHGSHGAASGANNTGMREAYDNEADEFADQASADEDSSSDHATGHPDIPRSFNEDFAARQAAAAARRQDAPLVRPHNDAADFRHRMLSGASGAYSVAAPLEVPSANSFNQPPPGKGNKHPASTKERPVPLSTKQGPPYDFKQIPAFASSRPPYSIDNLPPSINDRAAQEAAYAADFPWRLKPGGTLAGAGAGPDTLSKARARKQEVRQIAEKTINEKDAIEATDKLTGRAPFTRPYRMHDFDYDNLVASGHIGGPKATAKHTQQHPSSRKRAVEKDETLDESGNQVMDLMVNQLGLELEPMPPSRECFPPLTGPWADLPDHLTGRSNPNLK